MKGVRLGHPDPIAHIVSMVAELTEVDEGDLAVHVTKGAMSWVCTVVYETSGDIVTFDLPRLTDNSSEGTECFDLTTGGGSPSGAVDTMRKMVRDLARGRIARLQRVIGDAS